NLSNSAQTIGSQPLLGDVQWKRSTVRDKLEIPDPPGPPFVVEIDPDAGVADWITKARGKMSAIPGVPVMPGFFPLAVEGKLIYRTYAGLTAVNLRTKDEKGQAAKAGDIV